MQAEKERRAFKKQETRAKRETEVYFMTPNRLGPMTEVEMQLENERITFQKHLQTIAEEQSLTFEKHLQTIAEEQSLSGLVKRQRKFSEKRVEMQAEKERRAFKKQETRDWSFLRSKRQETGVNFMTPNRLGPVTVDIVEGGLLNTIAKLKLDSKENGDQEALGSSQGN